MEKLTDRVSICQGLNEAIGITAIYSAVVTVLSFGKFDHAEKEQLWKKGVSDPSDLFRGKNRGKYPFCHSLYIDGAGILIDPASDRKRLKRLRKDDGVNQVWLSHWHEDHFMHLDLFEDVPLLISEPDAPQLSDVESFLDGYGIENEEHRRVWREIVTTRFHFRPRKPTGFLHGGQQIRLEDLTIDIIHTSGHTPGHLCFFFQETGVLFLGDYDLTPFGPLVWRSRFKHSANNRYH